MATIALTGEVRGEVEPCGCPTLPYGGFARRQALLQQIALEGPPLFQLDAGDALLKGVVTQRTDDDGRRALAVLELMRTVGVQAMAPAPSDLMALGLPGLKEATRAGPALTSATWIDADGELVFPPVVVVESGGVKLGVVGLSASPQGTEGVDAKDPVEAARLALSQLPEGLDLVVGLSNLAEPERVRVEREVQGFSVLLSTMGADQDAVRFSGLSPVVETPDRGRYLTLLHLQLGADAQRPLELDPSDRLAKRVQLQRGLTRIGAEVETRPQLEADLASASGALEAAGAGRNLVWVGERPLGADLGQGVQAAEAVARFKQSTIDKAVRVVSAPVRTGEVGFATSSGCVRCHSTQLARWTYTAHKGATTTLKVRSEQSNPECISCHSTGFAQPGGFAELTETALRTYGGVQCESCHGPLAGHPRDPLAVPDPVTEQTCLGCHDQANSPGFNYSQYLLQVVCPVAPGAMPTNPPGSDPPLPAP